MSELFTANVELKRQVRVLVPFSSETATLSPLEEAINIIKSL